MVKKMSWEVLSEYFVEIFSEQMKPIFSNQIL